ncbi:MAG: sugar ABC transporter permease [Chloroflexi bacterium]|nr:sugar ABC transporter permease [Anaerolineaceae bacterium]NMB90061.1 sugar ABC transporter permease [Chloroflexota bacterium]
MIRSKAKARAGLLLTLPSFLFVFALLVYPVVYLIRLSFFDYSPLRSTDAIFVGLENYAWLFSSDTVLHSLWVTLLFTLLSVALEVLLGLVIATLMAKLLLEGHTFFDRLFANLANGFFILPFATPAITAAIAWKMLLQPSFGPVNAIIHTQIAWFSEYPLFSIIVADAWKMTPMVMFLFLAAILSIDPNQFEAAKIDGASAWQEFRYLTLPNILPILGVTAAFRAVDAFTKVFDIVFMTTGGGPGNDTEVFPLLVWKTAFSHMRFGQASSLAVVAILISLLLSGALVLTRRRA